MTALMIVHCDAVHPDRTPQTCRAFLPTRATTRIDAFREAAAAGWGADPDYYGDLCPSCSRDAS